MGSERDRHFYGPNGEHLGFSSDESPSERETKLWHQKMSLLIFAGAVVVYLIKSLF